MKFRGVELPKWWWFPFLGIGALLAVGIGSIAIIWTGGLMSDADRARIPIERGSPSIEQLDKAITLNPDYRLAYEKRARARLDSGDITGAVADIERAVAFSPQSPTLLQLRAEIRSRLATTRP
jgi:tetratricopeptide (TPR) repeat protein